MKILLYIGLALVLAIVFWACSGAGKPDANASYYNRVSVDEFKTKLQSTSNPQLVDVRTAGEVANGAIQGSKNMDFFAANFKDQMSQLDKEKPLFLYCAKGGRSAKASKIMGELGFKEVYDLEGGYGAWK